MKLFFKWQCKNNLVKFYLDWLSKQNIAVTKLHSKPKIDIKKLIL